MMTAQCRYRPFSYDDKIPAHDSFELRHIDTGPSEPGVTSWVR